MRKIDFSHFLVCLFVADYIVFYLLPTNIGYDRFILFNLVPNT